MAYNKRNWKARQGTGLNYFSIDGATPVPIVNQPTTLTEAGDALSAGNLNDWEQRIEDGFDDADASIANVQGNLETYETTNDMRVAANSQDIQNIQNALSGTVIQEHVDNTQKNVKTILSADELLPWAILKRVGARSTQFNQLVENGDFSNGTSGWSFYSYATIISVSDGICTLTSGSDGFSLYRTIPTVPAGHVVLVSYEARSNDTTDNLAVVFGSVKIPSESLSSTFKRLTVLTTSLTDESSIKLVRYYNTSGHKIDVRNVMLIDLTTMSEYDSGKTDVQNIASFRAKFPASYYAPNAGDIYDVPPLSFLIRGTNQWDEEWESGDINVVDGQKRADSSRCRSKNFIEVEPLTTYYTKTEYPNTTICCYDADGNWVSSEYQIGYFSGQNTTFTTPSWCHKVILYYNGNTYNHDIMICLNSVTDKTYKPFIGQTIDTSFMAGKKYVNPNCYDYAENVYVNGILKRKNQTVVGSYTFTGEESWADAGSFYYSTIIQNNVKSPSANWVKANILCAIFDTVTAESVMISGEKGIAVSDGGLVVIDSLDSISSLTGKTLYYELATLPDPTYGDPIPNFPCEDGSTITAITPQTDIVNAIDVPSTIGYSTKIA